MKKRNSSPLLFITLLCSVIPCFVLAKTPMDTKHPRETITMDYLMESCTVIGETAGGLVPYFDCESYLYGLLDAHLAVRDKLKAKDAACFPAKIAPWQIYEQLGNLVPRNAWTQPAAPLIIEALRKHYPCT